MTTGDWLRSAASPPAPSRGPGPQAGRSSSCSRASAASDKAHLLAHPEQPLSDEERSRADELLRRRASREPLQYILGVQEFWGLAVKVGPGCLIPRPETEHLVEATLAVLKGAGAPAVAEVGTGSGCVLMALGAERPDARLVGVERDLQALKWSKANLAGMPRLMLCQGDLDAANPLRGLDALVSNPPYITDGEWEELQPEVRGFRATRCPAMRPRPASTLPRPRRLGGHLAQARRFPPLRTGCRAGPPRRRAAPPPLTRWSGAKGFAISREGSASQCGRGSRVEDNGG